MSEISRRVSALTPAGCEESTGSMTGLIRSVLVVILVSCAFVVLSLLLTASLQAAPSVSPLAAQNPAVTTIDQVDDGWTKRVKLTFTNTAQTRDLVSFPVLVVLDSSRVDYAYTQDAGEDIRFVDADGVTVLAHEIERWDESGTSYVWVKVPRIDGSSNTDHIWLYYGNPNAADGQDPANVFTDTYRMVYHLEEDPGTNGGVIYDSTANGFHGTNQGTTDAAGFIANALEFSGDSQYVDLGSDLAVINEVTATTLSAWIRPDSVSHNGDILALSRYHESSPIWYSRASIVQRSANLQVYARSIDDETDFHYPQTRSNPLSADTWHFVVAVVDYANDAVEFYVDGVFQPSFGDTNFKSPITPNTNSNNCAIGSNDNGDSPYFDGLIDEVRVAASASTADWVAAQYLSMTDSFVAFGSEENIDLPVFGLYAWASREEVYAGSRLDYSLLVRNLGSPASQLVVSDALPAHTTFGGCNCAHAGWIAVTEMLPLAVGGCGTYSSCGLDRGKVVWRVDEMAPGRLLQMTFWVTVDAGLADGTVLVNDDYTVVADRMAPLVFYQPVTTTVREMLVSVTGKASPNPVAVGQRLQFTITVRNDGGLLQNVTVTDRLPSNVSFLGCGGALCELEGDLSEVRWWLSSLPAQSEQQLTLFVSVDSADGEMLVNEHYGAWIPEARRYVMGTPIAVSVLTAAPWPHAIYLPFVLSAATQ